MGGASFIVVVSDKKLKSGTTQETTQEITDKIIQLIKENPQLSRRAMAELVGISENGVKYPHAND